MRTKWLSLLVVVLALFSGTQTVIAQSADEAAVAQALESLRKAAFAKDRGQLSALVSDHVSYGHSAGRIENKQEYIDVALASKAVLKSLTFTDQKYQVNGNNAIVRYTHNSESELDGKTSTVKVGVMTVWQKEQGTWRLFARQAFRL